MAQQGLNLLFQHCSCLRTASMLSLLHHRIAELCYKRLTEELGLTEANFIIFEKYLYPAMPKLFNKSRKQLLGEKKTVQYVKYALGEILLVVIGILIALYISNWSEDQKEHADEKYILAEVLNNLKEDAVLIDQIIVKRTLAKNAIESMRAYLPTHTINPDSLSADLTRFITFERYFPINHAFEILKSKGLKLSNNNLTTRISRYYDYEQYRVQRSIEDVEEAIIPLITNNNGLKRYFTTMDMNRNITVGNPGNLGFQNELYDELNGFKYNNIGTLDKLMEFREINRKLVRDLDIELKQL